MVTRRVIECQFLIRTRWPLSLPLNAQRLRHKKHASNPLKSISQANGHVLYFIRLQAAVPGPRCDLPSIHRQPLRNSSPALTCKLFLPAVDSEMCETAVSQKIDLVARVESVLVGSVKMSECSQTSGGEWIPSHLPKRHVSDHAVLHPRAIPPRQVAPARRRPCKVVREAQV
jgi:hypothetical protein